MELLDFADFDQVDSVIGKFAEASSVPVPLAKPVIVGETVVVRHSGKALGVDLKTGKRTWQFPHTIPTAGQPPNRALALMRQAQLRERVWQDRPFHDLATVDDGVLLIHDDGFVGRDTGARTRGRFDKGPRLKLDVNEIMSLSIPREGALIWRLGRLGDEPKLKDALFLCSPVANEKTLYCLARIMNRISLLAIEPATGQLAWQLPVYKEANGAGDFRRLHGAKLAVSDGIAVCPTVDGVVVGVDLQQRKVSWRWEYQSLKKLGTSLSIAPQPLVIGDRIIMMPPDSLSIFCLDLRTGAQLWVADRGEHGLIAASDDHLLLTSSDSISARNMSTGGEMWKSKLVKDGFVTGRGIVLGDSYYVPTSKSEIVRVTLDKGKIVERINAGEVLGNLLFHNDSIISCDAKRLVRIKAEFRE